MSISRLPSGRYRAQVWDTRTTRNVSVSLILGGVGSFDTREEAAAARTAAREVLASNPDLDFSRAAPAERWGVPVKGEASCRNCGDPATHLHHIVPRVRSRFGRDDWRRNGLPLCAACHLGWHHRTVEIAHEVLTDEEFAFACDQAGVVWVDRNYPGVGSARLRLDGQPA